MDPDAENFDIHDKFGERKIYIDKSSKKLTKKSFIDKISTRILQLEF